MSTVKVNQDRQSTPKQARNGNRSLDSWSRGIHSQEAEREMNAGTQLAVSCLLHAGPSQWDGAVYR